MTGCYYHRRSADSFESTGLTRSNWTPDIPHGSPPPALLTRAIEEQLGDSGLRIGRLNLDILGASPVAPVTVRTSVPRPGRRIALVAAEMTPVDTPDRPVARVTAWALATSDTSAAATDRYPPLTVTEPQPLPEFWWVAPGYLESVDWQRRSEDAGRPRVLADSAGRPSGCRTDDGAAATGHGGRRRQRRRLGPEPRGVHVHEHRHRGAPAPAADRRAFRNPGARVHRAGRNRRHHRRTLRPTGVRGDVGADTVGTAALT
jgi:hypothetical protein